MINISIGKSRKAKVWKNTTLEWSEFVDRLNQPIETKETKEQYEAMTKDERAEAKDVGGFVGGELRDGERKATHVVSRSILTLDLDYAVKDFIDEYELFHGHESVIYTTHSHTEQEPRYRLIVLLSRKVSPDEYEAISRQLAGQIDIEQFDPTSFQPSRFMYWPSHSKGGKSIVTHTPGEPLDVDDILNRYDDWRNIDEWPKHSDETDIKSHKGERVADPTMKNGVIGAFNRTYTVAEAIDEFLSDVYKPGSIPSRYTYIDGSTSDGLVIYDEILAYSHHSTDPAAGHARNAFDLVRIHLYGELDENSRAQSPTTMPSYRAMVHLLESDEKIEEEKQRAVLESINEDFDVIDDVEETPKFRLTESGTLKFDPFNLELILRHDKHLAGKIGYNEFLNTFSKREKIIWEDTHAEDWSDEDTAQLKSYVNTHYKLNFSDSAILDALLVVSKDDTFNPVKDYIRAETWDGVERIKHLFVDFLGAEASEYVEEVTELWFGAAVSRIYKPGCKFDYIPVLQGAQGMGKSTLVRKLAPEWFTDSIGKLDGNKDDLQLLGRVWLVELGELASLSRSDVDSAKRFISAQEDQYRSPYGKRPIKQKRQVVFIGSTNNETYLKDLTGNRRWLPVECNARNITREVFSDELDDLIPQLWAEAYELYKTRYKYGNWLDLSNASKKEASEAQALAETPDTTKERVIEYLSIPKPLDWHSRSLDNKRQYIEWYENDAFDGAEFETLETEEQKITSSKEIYDVYFVGYQFESHSVKGDYVRRKIGSVLTNLREWESVRVREGGRQVRAYERVLVLN